MEFCIIKMEVAPNIRLSILKVLNKYFPKVRGILDKQIFEEDCCTDDADADHRFYGSESQNNDLVVIKEKGETFSMTRIIACEVLLR